MTHGGVTAVVLDIEGTTGSLTHVQDVLFPYARPRIAGWVAALRGSPEHAELLDAVRAETGEPALDEAGAVAALEGWADTDTKAAPLKAVQGGIWAGGYREGVLHGHVYPDVPPALRRWRAAGVTAHVYSSGSAAAQRDWFRHSDLGDLSGLLHGHFDLENAGPKREPDSYRAITAALAVPARATVFLSDVAGELDAAAAAGWRTLGVRRPDDPRGADIEGHRTISTFEGLDLSASPAPAAAGDRTADPATEAFPA
ncbi:acireductone synthase [Streptantibioticus silvisoli]|uniref:Enolase-phosphatase E1 n=1 Tax=Streptantibioticus silvisoli TaxID=2705255 RepID=A0ABT6W6K7_9ACTN|nr:acireductone synthase [Streptantibioticus silvisoli]MDI5966025.1 acireductone synthase [Streptantibioticus silvisoli]